MLEKKDAGYLFNYLSKVDSFRAAQLNISDKQNPRRLIRAIEISLSKPTMNHEQSNYKLLQIGLTASREHLYQLVDQRVEDRISAGAAKEDPVLGGNPQKWKNLEHSIIRHQLTWFKNQPGIAWLDISQPGWEGKAALQISNWYNE